MQGRELPPFIGTALVRAIRIGDEQRHQNQQSQEHFDLRDTRSLSVKKLIVGRDRGEFMLLSNSVDYF